MEKARTAGLKCSVNGKPLIASNLFLNRARNSNCERRKKREGFWLHTVACKVKSSKLIESDTHSCASAILNSFYVSSGPDWLLLHWIDENCAWTLNRHSRSFTHIRETFNERAADTLSWQCVTEIVELLPSEVEVKLKTISRQKTRSLSLRSKGNVGKFGHLCHSRQDL